MNVKHVGLCAMVVIMLGVSAVRAEDPPMDPGQRVVRPITYGGDPTPPPPSETGPSPIPQVSKWITGPECDCCGPFGGKTLGYEVYLRSGVSLPFGSSVLAKDLDPGWTIQGGARLLIFNPTKLAAWTVDLSVSNTYSHARGENKATLQGDFVVPNPAFDPTMPPSLINPTATTATNPDVTFNGLNRTFVNAAFGREWYLWNPANCNGWMWRAGIDAGPRYGSGKLDLNEITHRTRVFGGAFISLHTDIEWPCGACIYQAGFRAEWDYTFSDILQSQNNGDVLDVNLMLTLGVRF
jgi:hypothetical protein